MGSKKEKTSSVQDTTSAATSTTAGSVKQTNPAWVEDPLKAYTGKVGDLLNADPSSFTMGATGNQQGAFDAVGRLGQVGAPAYASAADALGKAGGPARDVTGASVLDGLSSYMDPYLDQVRGTALNDFDVNAGRTRAAQAAKGAQNAAFGGSRWGVQEGQTEGELARGRGSLDAGLLDSGFRYAAELSAGDAARRQAAATSNQASDNAGLDRQANIGGLFTALGGQQSGDARANLGLQSSLGDMERNIGLEQRTAPLSLFNAVGGMLGEGQFGLFNGSDTTGTSASTGTEHGTGTSTMVSNPGLLGTIAKGVQTGASMAKMFSDERVKRDIETAGYDDKGRRWVTFRYAGEDPLGAPHYGVIAQEVAETDPDAVAVDDATGLLKVDYSQLEDAR